MQIRRNAGIVRGSLPHAMLSPDRKIVTATWETPLSGDFWKKLENYKADTSETRGVFTLGPILPDDDDARIATAIVHRHEGEGELHWALAVRPAPPSEPPESVKRHDRLIGGRRGLCSLLMEAFAPGVPAVARFDVRLFFSDVRFRCALIPTVVEQGGGHDAALLLGRDARLEQVGYRFESGGVGGIQEVALMYLHVDGQYRAVTSAVGPLKLGYRTWLPFADDISELVQNAFFSPAEALK